MQQNGKLMLTLEAMDWCQNNLFKLLKRWCEYGAYRQTEAILILYVYKKCM